MRRKHIIHPSEAETYVPPRHKGTLNYRLTGRCGLLTENLDVALGELQKGGEAEFHYHKESEQALFVISGKCEVETLDGYTEEASQEDLVILPKGLGHRIGVTSGPFRALVIYAPKLGDRDIIAVDK
jgi:quercetin dioxygenase-like cupin family protein